VLAVFEDCPKYLSQPRVRCLCRSIACTSDLWTSGVLLQEKFVPRLRECSIHGLVECHELGLTLLSGYIFGRMLVPRMPACMCIEKMLSDAASFCNVPAYSVECRLCAIQRVCCHRDVAALSITRPLRTPREPLLRGSPGLAVLWR